jgi:hypothetical protein
MEEGSKPKEREVLDLRSQLEELLTAVRSAEANWRFDDRLDLAVRLHDRRPRARRRAA